LARMMMEKSPTSGGAVVRSPGRPRKSPGMICVSPRMCAGLGRRAFFCRGLAVTVSITTGEVAAELTVTLADMAILLSSGRSSALPGRPALSRRPEGQVPCRRRELCGDGGQAGAGPG
jgi:hypothetical protein